MQTTLDNMYFKPPNENSFNNLCLCYVISYRWAYLPYYANQGRGRGCGIYHPKHFDIDTRLNYIILSYVNE